MRRPNSQLRVSRSAGCFPRTYSSSSSRLGVYDRFGLRGTLYAERGADWLWVAGAQVQVVAGELRRQVNERVDCLAENMGNHEAATRDPDSLIFRSNPWVRPREAC